jgi:choline dehydrogenase-like flavoprotein
MGTPNDSLPAIATKGKADHTFDAIVIGSGMTGGWAAKELCEKGLKTLVLERGRNIEHNKDYPTAMTEAWQLPHRNTATTQMLADNPIASRCYAFNEATQHFFVKDAEHPYVQEKPFDWIRGYQVGGKSLLWARWVQRWSDLDFEANAREGIGVDWPIRYKDIEPWYGYVEKFVGISGNRDGIPHLPDGIFQPPMEMNCIETHLKQTVESHYQNRHVIISRTANLTKGLNGRGPCQYRDRCARGCPYAGYFSSVSATLPAAYATGNMTLRPHAVVHSLIYDAAQGKATGVRVIDAQTKQATEYFAKIIFLNAGTLNSTLILLHSTSPQFPAGLGNTNDVLGHYLMDHNYRGHINARHDGFQDRYYFGKRPAGIYIPRFRNIGPDKQPHFLRGYAFAAGGNRHTGHLTNDTIGASLKEQMTEAGPWEVWMTGMGECLPAYENKVTLSTSKKDQWGMPLLQIDCEYKQNETAMLKDMLETGSEMLERAGFTGIQAFDSGQAPGLGIHEMGTARMGTDPKTSVLNRNNQVWDAKNVFVTDGACMTSSACQNPSLTYMALTARAVQHAIQELKKQNL